MIKERNKARKENLSNYKELRNKCVKLINRDKRNETSRKLDVNPYAIWKIYKELEKGVECSEIKLKQNDEIISNNREVANILNIHFKEKIINIKKSLPQSNNDPFRLMKEHIGQKKTTFQIKPISLKEAKTALKELKPKMSSGISGVPKKTVKMLVRF